MLRTALETGGTIFVQIQNICHSPSCVLVPIWSRTPTQYLPPPFPTRFIVAKPVNFRDHARDHTEGSSRPPRHALWSASGAVSILRCAPQSWLGSGQKESAGEEALRG